MKMSEMRNVERRGALPALKIAAWAVVAAAVLVSASASQTRTVEPELWWRVEAPPAAASEGRRAVRACASLSGLVVGSARVVAAEIRGPAASAWCRATLKSPIAGSSGVNTIWVALPLETWNGRFLGLGGGGLVSGLAQGAEHGAALGFAAASVDGASTLESQGAFARDAAGELDWPAVRNFAHGATHEMAQAGKALARTFYGQAPRYSYFAGCSGGGRQALAAAQRHPTDFDGVLAGAPAIHLPVLASNVWPQVVLRETGAQLPACKQESFRRAAIRACDAQDGRRDGAIARPDLCRFDPRRLVGRESACGTITAAEAEAMWRIWSGPRRKDGAPMGPGWPRDAPAREPTGALASLWLRHFLPREPGWTLEMADRAAFEAMTDVSVRTFGPALNAADPDLSAFARWGGKLIVWHGMADANVPFQATVEYATAVQRRLGDTATDRVLRVYLPPGVAHCGGGEGAQPIGLFAALMRWVEQGRAPGAIPTQSPSGQGGAAPRLEPYRGQPALRAQPVSRRRR